jgi:integrase
MLETEVRIYAQSGLGHFVSYIDPFTKRRVRTRIGDRDAAEKYRKEVIEKLSRHVTENAGAALVNDLILLHIKDHPKTELARSPRLLEDFCSTFGTLKIKEVTTDMVRSWLSEIQKEDGLKESTLYGHRSKINVFFRDMVKRGILAVSPVEGLFYLKRSIETMRKPIVLNEDEISDLLKKAKEYSPGLFYPMFLAFIETAAKSSDILELKWDAVDFKNGAITFPGDKTLAARTIPISKELQGCLAKKRPVSDYVFTSLYDEKMTKRKLSEYINKFKEHYAIREKWMYFDLRHSFACNFLARGGDMKKLKTILGVRSLQTAEVVYGQHLPRRLDTVSPFE